MSVPSALAPFADLFQERTLIREFQDGLLQSFLFDAVAPDADEWPAHAGLTFRVTNDGYLPVTGAPSPTTVDPTPQGRRAEQYDMTLNAFMGSIDIDATQAQNMLADYAVKGIQRLGVQAAETMDVIARGRYASAATAGQTVADGAQGPTTTLRVMRLSGLTTALPATGGALAHAPVSVANPLPVYINGVLNQITGFAADCVIPIDQAVPVPDEIGPGTITLANPVTVVDRDPVCAANCSWIQRAGAAANRRTGRVDDVKGPISYADIRAAKAHMKDVAVKGMRRYNGYYLTFIAPTAYAQLQGDPEFQRLEQGRGVEDFPYEQGVVGIVNQCLFLENNNNPSYKTVKWRDPAGTPTPYVYGRETRFGSANASTDVIGIETIVGTNQDRPIDYTLIMGDDAAKHMWQPHPLQAGVAGLTEIGVAGVLAEGTRVVNDGVALDIGYVQMLMVSPRNRTMDKYPATWYSKRSWTLKSDQISPAAGGIRYPRAAAIESAASA